MAEWTTRRIRVRGPDGRPDRWVEAQVLDGILGLHRAVSCVGGPAGQVWYTVTHLPTGYKLPGLVRDFAMARDFTEFVAAVFDWRCYAMTDRRCVDHVRRNVWPAVVRAFDGDIERGIGPLGRGPAVPGGLNE